MSRVFEIADRYVDQIAALEPLMATSMGIPGHEREMPDLSQAGPARVAELNRKTSAELTKAATVGEADRIAREPSATPHSCLAVNLQDHARSPGALEAMARGAT